MFDPYHKWLGIPKGQRPPTHYQLLGVAPDETDSEVIEEMAIRQTSHVRTYQMGPHAAACARLLGEIAQACRVLLDPGRRRRYDAQLSDAVAEGGPPAAGTATGGPPVVAAFATAAPCAVLDGLVVELETVPAPQREPPRPRRRRRRRAACLPALAVVGLLLGAGGAALWRFGPAWGMFSAPGGVTAAVPAPAVPPAPAAPASEERRFPQSIGPVHAVAFSPDGQLALSAGGSVRGYGRTAAPVDCALHLWEVKTGKEVRRLVGQRSPVHSVAFSADGRFLLAGSGRYEQGSGDTVAVDCTVRLWDVAEARELGCFEGHAGPVRGVAFLPGGGTAVSCGEDGTVRFWDVETGREAGLLTGPGSPLESLAVAPDGALLCGDAAGMLHLWDWRSNRKVRDFRHGAGPVSAVAVSPDGRLALSAGGRLDTRAGEARLLGGAARVWDLRTGREVCRLGGHTQPVLCVAFAADGRLALSAGRDHTVRLWDAGGKEVARREEDAAAIESAAFSPDGRQVLLGCGEGGLRLWTFPRPHAASP